MNDKPETLMIGDILDINGIFATRTMRESRRILRIERPQYMIARSLQRDRLVTGEVDG